MVSGGWWLLQIAILLAAQGVIRAQGQGSEGDDSKKETIIGQQIEDGKSSTASDSEEKDSEVEKDPSDMMGEKEPSYEDGDKDPSEKDGEKEPSDKDREKEPSEKDGEKETSDKDGDKEPIEDD